MHEPFPGAWRSNVRCPFASNPLPFIPYPLLLTAHGESWFIWFYRSVLCVERRTNETSQTRVPV